MPTNHRPALAVAGGGAIGQGGALVHSSASASTIIITGSAAAGHDSRALYDLVTCDNGDSNVFEPPGGVGGVDVARHRPDADFVEGSCQVHSFSAREQQARGRAGRMDACPQRLEHPCTSIFYLAS